MSFLQELFYSIPARSFCLRRIGGIDIAPTVQLITAASTVQADGELHISLA